MTILLTLLCPCGGVIQWETDYNPLGQKYGRCTCGAYIAKHVYGLPVKISKEVYERDAWQKPSEGFVPAQ